MVKIIISVIIFLVLNNVTHSQWHFVKPTPTGNAIDNIHFFDENTGIISPLGNSIFKTKDGGKTFKEIFLDVSHVKYFRQDLNFFNDNSGYITKDGKVYKTTDRGESWILKFDNPTIRINKLYAFNGNKVFCTTDSNKLLKTFDDFSNFEIDEIGLYLNSINKILFTNDSTGFIGGSKLFVTKDYGNTWTQIRLMSYNFTNISFTNDSTGYISSTNGLFKTTNGGLDSSSWSRILYVNNYENIFVSALDSVVTISTALRVYISTNSGESWKDQGIIWDYGSIYSLRLNLVTPSKIFLAGGAGYFVNSTNFGVSWDTLFVDKPDSLKSPREVEYRSNGNAFISTRNMIFKSSDGGYSWDSVYYTNLNFSSHGNYSLMRFTNDNTGYAYFNRRNIVKTTNAGDAWNEMDVSTGNEIRDIAVDNNYILLLANPWIYRSTDFGSNWDSVPVPSYSTMIKYGYGHVIIANESGAFHFSTNFGNTFYQRYIPGLVQDFIIMDSTKLGFLSGRWFYKTQGFFGAYTSHSIPISGIRITEATKDIYYICGTEAGIIRSTNKGESWVQEVSNSYDNLISGYPIIRIAFKDSINGLALNHLGSIIKRNPDYNVNIVSVNLEVPEKFYLNQNYPNPFNPQTTISFALSYESTVNLNVYDITGRLVSELLSDKLKPGTYEVNFNAGGLASGIYFYRLQTEKFTESRKMLLLK